MKYPKSERYMGQEYLKYIMGPNPLKLCEELMQGHQIPAGARIMDLGSGEGLTSAFLAKEYGFTVYAADLWSEPESHVPLFEKFGLCREQCIPVKADANALPFEKAFFDAVVSVDSYHYFARDPAYLDAKLLPFVKPGGWIYAVVPGMKKDCHDNIPEVLLRSWNAEQLDTIHDASYWRGIVSQSRDCELVSVREMQSNAEVWADWLKQENEYAIGDRAAMEHGGLDYLNFIAIVLRKK